MGDRRTVFSLVAIFAAVVLLWHTPVIYPLKVLVVLLHATSHGIAAVATGGSIESIVVSADEGGVCTSRGGNRFLTLSAGYLGSMAFGAGILIFASRSRFDRAFCGAFGAFLIGVTLAYVRNGFGFGFGLATGAALILGAAKLPDAFADVALKTIGLTSCLYAILDIKDDVLDRPGIGSDADLLAANTGVPAVVWGVVWIGAALAVAFFALRIAARGETAAAGGSGPPGSADRPSSAVAGGAPKSAADLLADLARETSPK